MPPKLMGWRSSHMVDRDRRKVSSRVAVSSGVVSPARGFGRVDAQFDHVGGPGRGVVDGVGQLDPLTLNG